MVYVLIAFLVGATASALMMAARERRRSCQSNYASLHRDKQWQGEVD